MEKELIDQIETTASRLLKQMEEFSQEKYNQVPFKGSWTPGQVVEHVFLSVDGTLRTVKGTTGPTHRDPRKMVAPLRDAFLNFSVKMQSPDFILRQMIQRRSSIR